MSVRRRRDGRGFPFPRLSAATLQGSAGCKHEASKYTRRNSHNVKLHVTGTLYLYKRYAGVTTARHRKRASKISRRPDVQMELVGTLWRQRGRSAALGLSGIRITRPARDPFQDKYSVPCTRTCVWRLRITLALSTYLSVGLVRVRNQHALILWRSRSIGWLALTVRLPGFPPQGSREPSKPRQQTPASRAARGLSRRLAKAFYLRI